MQRRPSENNNQKNSQSRLNNPYGDEAGNYQRSQGNPGARGARNNKNSGGGARRRGRKTAATVTALAVFLGLLVLAVLIFPKEPLGKAISSVGENDDPSLAYSTEAYKGLVISEIMASNKTSVPDETGEFHDWIELWNSSDRTISLKNVGLSDREDTVRFLFPDNASIPPDGRIIVFASDKRSTDENKYYHAKFKISSTGETITLSASNYFIDQVTTKVLNSDEVWALQEDGTYQVSTNYSPGYPNTEEGFLAYRSATSVTEGVVIINEVMADAATGLKDEDGELSDWIELKNTSNSPVSLANYALSDKEDNPLKWRFPSDAVIPANGYYLVFCSDKDRHLGANSISHTNFKISAERETIILSDAHGRMVDRVHIDNMPKDKTYGRNENNVFVLFDIGTPGLPNNDAGAAQAQKNMIANNPTGVYITEVMASNSATTLSNKGPYTDFVELYNSSDQILSLEGYGLSDNIKRPRKWQFPSGSVIYPGEYKIIYLDGEDVLENSRYHTNFKLTRGGGETMVFCDPNGQVLDRIDLPLIPTDISYGRSPSLDGFFYFFDTPTPSAQNSTEGFTGFAPPPQIMVSGGLYHDIIATWITVPENTTVYYTTNGDIPTIENGTLYQGQTLEFTKPTVLRARAFQNNLRPSDTVTQSYIVNTYHTLPVVSLSIDGYELYNPETGLMVSGYDPTIHNWIRHKALYMIESKETGERVYPVYREYGKDLRPSHIEYYYQDNTKVIDQDAMLSWQGQFSLDLPQKSIKVKAKASQGVKYFDAALFDDRPFTQYKGFVLRISGNDSVWTRIADGLQSRLMDYIGTEVIHQAWNPVVVYINGQYWGHYNMRERVDRYFVAQHEGIPMEEADNMDILEASGTVFYGDNTEYKELIAKAKTLDPGKNPEDLQYLLDRIDVDNYFDYMAIEMFFGNSDPGNIRFYKLHGEGQKWKWILFDLDYGLYKSSFDSPYSYLKKDGAGDQYIDNTLILTLLKSPEMEDKFLTRLGEIFQMLTTEVMMEEKAKLVAMIEPEMPLHFDTWAPLNDRTINSDSPITPEGAMRYWQDRLKRMDDTLNARPALFYEMVKKQFKLSDSEMVHYFGEKPPSP